MKVVRTVCWLALAAVVIGAGVYAYTQFYPTTKALITRAEETEKKLQDSYGALLSEIQTLAGETAAAKLGDKFALESAKKTLKRATDLRAATEAARLDLLKLGTDLQAKNDAEARDRGKHFRDRARSTEAAMLLVSAGLNSLEEVILSLGK